MRSREMLPLNASVAQLVEQRIENPRVGGSNPSRGTTFLLKPQTPGGSIVGAPMNELMGWRATLATSHKLGRPVGLANPDGFGAFLSSARPHFLQRNSRISQHGRIN